MGIAYEALQDVFCEGGYVCAVFFFFFLFFFFFFFFCDSLHIRSMAHENELYLRVEDRLDAVILNNFLPRVKLYGCMYSTVSSFVALIDLHGWAATRIHQASYERFVGETRGAGIQYGSYSGKRLVERKMEEKRVLLAVSAYSSCLC